MRPPESLALSYPTGVPKRHFQALIASCEQIAGEFGKSLTGMLVGGSVARGVATVDSDVDLFVAFEGSWSQRRRRLVEGIEVDVFIDPASIIHNFVSNTFNDVILGNYAVGWIVYDPSGFMSRMKAGAQRGLARPRNLANAAEVFTQCERLRDRVRSLRRMVASDQLVANYILALLVQESVEAYYVLKRVWHPATKQVPEDLKRREPSLFRLLEDVLDGTSPLTERVDRAGDLAEVVLRLAPSEEELRIGPKIPANPPGTTQLRVGDKIVSVPKLSGPK